MNTLHIFKNTNETFSEPYIEFINDKFSQLDHFFYHIGKDIRKRKITRENICFITRLRYFAFIKDLYNAEKLIIHGLFSPQLVFLLFLQPWLLKKCFWCVWGNDLYFYRDRKVSFITNMLEFIRKPVIKNMKGLITYIYGDFELAQKWYKVKGEYHKCFLYPSNLYKPYNHKISPKTAKFYIQIGNSADPSNNHLEVLDKLKKYSNTNMKLICPLSYGDELYAEKVILKGKDLFGEKFIPIVKLLSFNDFIDLQCKIDIAIFNHNRQQGMGNITTLLGLGKKVYIRQEITTWDYCMDNNLTVFSSSEEFLDIFNTVSIKERNKNIRNIKTLFSEKMLIQDWKNIFNYYHSCPK